MATRVECDAATRAKRADDDDDDVPPSTSASPSSPLDAIADTLTRILADERALSALPGERAAFEKKLRAARFRARRAKDDDAEDARRARLDARRAVESIAFWRGLAEDDTKATQALWSLLRLALSGHDEHGVRVLGARALAAAYRPADADPDAMLTDVALFRCADALIAWQSAANFGSGFVAGLGGILTLPITIPAQLLANAFVALRLAFALAILAGKDPLEPSVAARAITSAIGGIVDDVDDDDKTTDGEVDTDDAVAAAKTHAAAVGVNRGVNQSVHYAAMRAQGVALQGTSWRLTRLAATALAERGASRSATMAATRAIPLIGGLIGGTVDGFMTSNAGRRALDNFFPPRPKRPFDLKEHFERSKNEALAHAKGVGEALNGAFDKMKVSFNKRVGNAATQNAGYPGSEGGYQSQGVEDDSWERWERERELEAMRAILEDEAMDYGETRFDAFGSSSSTTKNQHRSDDDDDASDETSSSHASSIDGKDASRREKELLWLEHNAAWKVFIEDFANDADPREMRYKDIPFPPTTSRILIGAAGGKRATPQDVKAAYRRLMLMYHPDRFSKFVIASDDREKVYVKLGVLSSQIKDQWLAYEAQREQKATKRTDAPE